MSLCGGNGQVFLGRYSHTIDAKGRIIIPSKYREELGDNFIISRGYDGCLYASDKDTFEELYDKLKSLPQSQKEIRRLRRFFFDATAAEYDKQGRVLIPSNLREYAGLEKDVVLLGIGDKVEIWNPERLKAIEEEDISGDEEAMERLAEKGFSII